MAKSRRLTAPAKESDAALAGRAAAVVGTKDEAASVELLRRAGRLPQTRKGQEAWVRSQPMLCVGPFKEGYDPDETRRRVNALRAQGKREEALRLDQESRAGCGDPRRGEAPYDYAKLIAQGSLDGEVHDYKCPQCGVEGTYRAPHFREDAPEKTRKPRARPR
jgi:hypothetical protein